MILGFTGTQQGMTQRQRDAVGYLFKAAKLHILHHGGCVGADEQAHQLAVAMKARVRVHPGPAFNMQRGCPDADLVYPVRPNLVRNVDIARLGLDGLIAAPAQDVEQLRSGTWATVRYARKMHRHVWIVTPFGTFREERNL